LKNSYFNAEGHFHKKYKELVQHMNEYVASSSETQEEIYRNYKLTKAENGRLVIAMQEMERGGFRIEKEVEVVKIKIDRLRDMVEIMGEKETNMALTIDKLE
jgi:hypothetical protein